MPKLTTDEFLDYLKRSELVKSERLEKALDALREGDGAESLKDADLLAGALVERGLITNWHVRQLMKRKYKGFYLRQYRILGHLGTGGMSTVYLAEHTVMQRRVAIKVLPKKKLVNAAYLVHFVQEAQATASLDHPNIVRAYDIDQLDDIHYIVMEYFEGVNLRQLVEKEGVLAYEDAVNYTRQAALGLTHAHRIGIVHRDIKPENLLVNDLGLLKILDLGLAMLDEKTIPTLSAAAVDAGKIIGTADYLAPEQVIDSAKIDGRADIYSLGATLYFCLTGHPPFPMGTVSQRLLAHLKEQPASIFKDRPDAPEDLVRICAKMMEKKAENRFRGAEEVVHVLERWLIHHGVANEVDFPDAVKPDDPIFQHEPDSTPLFMMAQYGNVTGISNETDPDAYPGSGVSGEIASQNIVNLFRDSTLGGDTDFSDSTPSGTVNSTPSGTVNADGVLSSRTSNVTRRQQKDSDFMHLALDELAGWSSTGNSSVGSSVGDSNREKEKGAPDDSKTNRSAAHSVSGRERPVSGREKKGPSGKSNTLAWHKQVPTWFWILFATGYIIATFVSGVLFAVLTNLNH